MATIWHNGPIFLPLGGSPFILKTETFQRPNRRLQVEHPMQFLAGQSVSAIVSLRRSRYCAALAVAVFLSGPLAVCRAQNSPVVKPREFAPGVLTTIAPDFSPEDAVSTHDLVEIRADKSLDWKPEFASQSRTLYGMAEKAKFRREVWCLEFSFKPLRMIEVPVTGADGSVQQKLVWYLVYKVRNTGQVMKPVEGEGGTFDTKLVPGGPIKFVPQFVFESHDRTSAGGPVGKSYLDRVIPAAVEAIRRRELPDRPLLNSVEMAEQEIPVSTDRMDKGVWGVATWTDLDPRIDFFSIYVGGLTNAYRWEDTPGAFKPGDRPGKGRRFARKMLQLNFWSPGDELLEHEREIRFGVAPGKADLYGVSEGVAYRWVYR